MRLLDLLEASPTDNPAFQRWFAGSKVVDAHGNPLRVYHGTTGDIEAFNDVAEGIDGIYFTAAPSIANQYADWRQGEGEEATVYATYLALKNPLVVDYMAYLKQNNDGEFADERDARGEFASEMVEEIVQTAKDFKRDGVILYNIRDGWTDNSELSTTYIAFYPNQIKSVFNRGTWDRSPKISESTGIPPELEPDWGVKIGKNARFFRGESETSGSNGASYGAGLYTTTSRKFASNYGKVRELSRWDALPDNPIRFRTNWDWEMWLQRYDQYHGILGARDRGQKHHDIGDYIRLVFPTADGAQIGTGNDAIFVKWPISESAITEQDQGDFQAWFGDSDIKNRDGSPKVMYHWGPPGITQFRGMPTSGWMIYWNADSKKANFAARNPEQEYRAYIKCSTAYGSPTRPTDWHRAETFSTRVKQDGYDGMWIRDEAGISLAVFDASQIWLID